MTADERQRLERRMIELVCTDQREAAARIARALREDLKQREKETCR